MKETRGRVERKHNIKAFMAEATLDERAVSVGFRVSLHTFQQRWMNSAVICWARARDAEEAAVHGKTCTRDEISRFYCATSGHNVIIRIIDAERPTKSKETFFPNQSMKLPKKLNSNSEKKVCSHVREIGDGQSSENRDSDEVLKSHMMREDCEMNLSRCNRFGALRKRSMGLRNRNVCGWICKACTSGVQKWSRAMRHLWFSEIWDGFPHANACPWTERDSSRRSRAGTIESIVSYGETWQLYLSLEYTNWVGE